MTTTVDVMPINPRATWRNRCAAVIGRVLAENPTAKDENAIRKLLQPHAPKGASYPVQMWYQEVRKAIDRRCQRDMTIRLVFTARTHAVHPEGLGPLHWIQNFLFVSVHCRWCQDLSEDIAGCLMCRKEIDIASEINTHDHFKGLAHSMRRGDPLAQLMLVDWLLERGHDDLAEQVRDWK